MRYQRLTQPERYQIMALLRSGLSKRAIARNLSRSPSTISRELERNSEEEYRARSAHRKYLQRRSVIHPPLKIRGWVKRKVMEGLTRQWSPEQISGRLRREGTCISHETIYQFIFEDFKAGGGIYLNLRRKRKNRRSQKAAKAFKQCGKRLSYPPISTRPTIVDERERLGDFERDTVLGKFKGPVLLSIVDRVSRLTKLGKIRGINAALAHRKTVQLLSDLPVHTITNDNGAEFADYRQTALELKTEVFFNDPYCSWQRGTNENTNGLIRQYFPKGTDFSKVSDDEIKHLEDLLNDRPRKSLGFKTPREVQRLKSQSVALST